jgi:ADP-ribose pyrophosphatase YjhB (NUDIX family)
MNPKHIFCPQCATRLVLQSSPEHDGQNLQVCPKNECGYTHWNNPLPVAVTLVPRRHKIALVKRKNNPGKGLWCPPCGFVNELESVQFAAKRETLEESSLTVDVDRLPIATAAPDGVNENISFFRARRFEGVLEAGDDADDAGWFSIDDLPELAFDTHREVIGKWFNRPQVRAWRLLAKVGSKFGVNL